MYVYSKKTLDFVLVYIYIDNSQILHAGGALMEYTQPEMEIIQFETGDIIATSVDITEPSTTVPLPTYLDPEDSIGGELG
jgi:hypothetical protein